MQSAISTRNLKTLDKSALLVAEGEVPAEDVRIAEKISEDYDDIVERIARLRVTRKHELDSPVGFLR